MTIDRVKEDEPRIEIEIRVGRVCKTMTLVKTLAPVAYDGFGTFTLYEERGRNGERLVLIDVVHFGWQVDRYGSGLHGWEYYGDETGRGWAEERLLARLMGQPEEE
jgi:hypothetical protein